MHNKSIEVCQMFLNKFKRKFSLRHFIVCFYCKIKGKSTKTYKLLNS